MSVTNVLKQNVQYFPLHCNEVTHWSLFCTEKQYRFVLYDGVVVCHCQELLDQRGKSHVFPSLWYHQDGLSILCLICHQLEEAVCYLRRT